MNSPNFVRWVGIAGLFLFGCADRIVVAPDPQDASPPDSPYVVDAAVADSRPVIDAEVTDSRDAAVEDGGIPPFTIPDAPVAGSLRPCGTTAEPMPVGFLQDGRAVIAQPIDWNQTLVRAWDPATNALEDIFTTESASNTRGTSLTMSQDGDRVVVSGGDVGFGWFRIFDWSRRRFVTDGPVQIAIENASGDGQFVIGRDLVRWNAIGAEPFDFSALLPANLHLRPDPGSIALSPSGDAVAVALFDREAVAVVLAVVYQDGRVVVLPPGPDSDLQQLSCVGECGVRWSRDGRRLLLFSPHLLLRVWDVEGNSLLVAEEPGVRWASFLPGGTRLITIAVSDSAVVEKDLGGGSIFTWGTALDNRTGFLPTLDATGNRLLFRGNRPGDQGHGLALATRDVGGVYWRHSVRAWENSALALAGNALFAVLQAWDPRVEPSPITIGRYPIGGGPLTHVLDSDLTSERQTEFQGLIVVSPDEQRVAAVLPDTVRVLDAATLAPLATIASGAGMVAWSPDGRYLASTPDLHYRDAERAPFVPRAEVTLWDALSGRAAKRFPVAVVPAKVAFDDQGNNLVGWGYSSVVAEGDRLVIFRTSGDRVSFEIDLATGRSVLSPVLLPFISATRELVATSTSILRVSTREVVSSLDVPPVQSAAFSGDGSMLLGLTGNSDGEVPLRLFGVKEGHTVASTARELYFPGRTALALSRDGRRVAVGTSDVVVYCLDERR